MKPGKNIDKIDRFQRFCQFCQEFEQKSVENSEKNIETLTKIKKKQDFVNAAITTSEDAGKNLRPFIKGKI